eukprot:scaffold108903_cov69-Phaeocystis_antarctica.AAC.6
MHQLPGRDRLAGREKGEGYTSVCSRTNRGSPGLLPAKFCNKHGMKYERGLIGCKGGSVCGPFLDLCCGVLELDGL